MPAASPMSRWATLPATGSRDGADLSCWAAGGIENTRLLLLVEQDVDRRRLGQRQRPRRPHFMEHPHLNGDDRPTGGGRRSGFMGCASMTRVLSVRLEFCRPRLQTARGFAALQRQNHPIYSRHESAAWLDVSQLVLSLSPGRRGDPLRAVPALWPRACRSARSATNARRTDQDDRAALLQLTQPNRVRAGVWCFESKSEQAPNPLSRVTLRFSRTTLRLHGAARLAHAADSDPLHVAGGERSSDVREAPRHREALAIAAGRARGLANQSRRRLDQGAPRGMDPIRAAGGRCRRSRSPRVATCSCAGSSVFTDRRGPRRQPSHIVPSRSGLAERLEKKALRRRR